MVYLYDQYENEFRNLDEVKGALIHGLNDESKMIKDTMAKFWNDKNRLDHDPLTRLQQLMDNMYNNDEEAIWLTNAAYMILKVSSESSDFNRKIFEEPLSECSFETLHLTMN
jgi:DNA-dependent protein kinase catalytic subunit